MTDQGIGVSSADVTAAGVGREDTAGRPFRDFASLIRSLRVADPPRLAVAGAASKEVLQGVALAVQHGIAVPILVGNAERIAPLAESVDLDLGSVALIDERDEAAIVRQAVGLVQRNEAQILMKGQVHTHVLMRAVLQREAGLRVGNTIGVVIVFQIPGTDRLVLATDPSINIHPSLEDKANLCRNAITMAHALGIKTPKVALIAASEVVRSDLPSTVDAACLSRLAQQGEFGDAIVDGPIQLDAALDSFVAKEKGMQSPVAGLADVLVLPDIEAANVLLKAVVYIARAELGGSALGARVPIVLQSRVDTPAGWLRCVALSALLQQYNTRVREGA